MTFTRDHDNLHVVLAQDQTGRIKGADLYQPSAFINKREDWIELTPDQLYALVDDVAVADPETWEKRFPPEEVAELALRRVADYFRSRAEVNRMANHLEMAATFDLAVTRVMEEIEALYENQDPTEHLNNYHARS